MLSFNCIIPVSFKNVLLEHLVYSAAIAVLAGLVFSRYTGRDPSWIIIAVAFVPDIDLALSMLRRVSRRILTATIHHGDLHTVILLMVFSVLFAVILQWAGIRFTDGLICSALGIAAHFFEDALVYNPAYAFLWPVSMQKFGIGILQESRDVFGIASSTVLLVGIMFLFTALLIRTYFEGTGWWRMFLRGGRTGTSSSP